VITWLTYRRGDTTTCLDLRFLWRRGRSLRDAPSFGTNTCSLKLTPVAPPPARQATILHADLDAFYASVEQLLDPSLRNRPIAVGRSVVLAASYEARSYGVRGGMSAWRARQICGDLHFVGGHFERYQEFGDDVVSVFHDFTPRVERVSIDEAFLDVAGVVHLFGAPTEIADAIRRRVRDEIGLPLSVGVARTKHLAKVASQVAKPDGLVAVAPNDERASASESRIVLATKGSSMHWPANPRLVCSRPTDRATMAGQVLTGDAALTQWLMELP